MCELISITRPIAKAEKIIYPVALILIIIIAGTFSYYGMVLDERPPINDVLAGIGAIASFLMLLVLFSKAHYEKHQNKVTDE